MLFKPSFLLLLGSYLASSSASIVVSAEEKLNTFVHTTDRCTSIVVSKGAGVEGPMTTHTADCADCDFRINKVAAADWPAGSVRTLYQYKGSYPATVVSDRGKTWHPDNLEGTPEQVEQWKEFETSLVTGHIPQVQTLPPSPPSITPLCVFFLSSKVPMIFYMRFLRAFRNGGTNPYRLISAGREFISLRAFLYLFAALSASLSLSMPPFSLYGSNKKLK